MCVCERLRDHLPGSDAEQAEAFVRQYYRWVAPDDLAERSELDVYGAALAHFDFARSARPARRRSASTTRSSRSTAGSRRTPPSRSSPTTCRSSSTPSTMELNRRGFGVHLIIHPVIAVRRDERRAACSRCSPAVAAGRQDAITESVLHAEVDRQTDPAELDGARSEHVERVIGEVRAAVEDWPAMRAQALDIAAELAERAPPPDRPRTRSPRPRRSSLARGPPLHLPRLPRLRPRATRAASCGCAAVPGHRPRHPAPGDGASASRRLRAPAAARCARWRASRYLLNLTKANSRATVHRPAYLDYVGVKRFDEEGNVVGERRFLGLYTHAAYHANPRDIPILRRKVDAVLERAGLPARQPRREGADRDPRAPTRATSCSRSPVDELFEIAMGILHLGERQRVRLFVRRDGFGRFVSCLVFVPRDRFNTDNRRRIERILREAFGAESIDYTTLRLSESVLVRMHYTSARPGGVLPDATPRELEARIVEATRSWDDDLAGRAGRGARRGARQRAVPPLRRGVPRRPTATTGSRARRSPTSQRIEALERRRRARRSRLYRPLEAAPGALRCKVFRARRAARRSSDMLPMFENTGRAGHRRAALRARAARRRRAAWIYDFGLQRDGGELDADAIRERFQDAFIARLARRGRERRLQPSGPARAADCARGHGAARGRALPAPGRHDLQRPLHRGRRCVAHPDVAALLVELFHARFDPRGRRARGRERARGAIEQRDRRGRRASTRTASCAASSRVIAGDAAHQLLPARRRGPSRTCRSSSTRRGCRWLPLPRPQFEIFVYSPRVEGVHLRGGTVARGGLRWSDRREDFRTEVLGPDEGADGQERGDRAGGREGRLRGQAPPATRRRCAEEGACYARSSAALLDITDNIVGGRGRAARRDVVRYDGDDPYLVVAADKGTATFSDIANGDRRSSTASGSATRSPRAARPATTTRRWASPRAAPGSRSSATSASSGMTSRPRTSPSSASATCRATCSATGCCSRAHIRLVGAFDHRHIFLDPDPDPARVASRSGSGCSSCRARRGPTTTCALISKGGGVFPRSAKSIPLSPEVRAVLGRRGGGADAERADPRDPARARRPVLERRHRHLRQGERARRTRTPATRPTTRARRRRELRCRVVGEGGNLGFTQRGRIEYAHGGGRVNTDAIDNSAGVDCSDHEVNIKILLDASVAEGDLTGKQRDALLAEMTDAVAASVLKNDYEQAETLTLAETQAPAMLDVHARFIRYLEARATSTASWRRCPPTTADRRAQAGRGLVLRARARGAARLRQDRPLPRAAGLRRPRGPVSRRRAPGATSPPPCPSASASAWRGTGCGARSSPPRSSTTCSTEAARRSPSACMRSRARRPPTSRARTRWPARCSGCARSGRRSRRSTTRSPPSCRWRCCSRAASWWSAGRAGCCATAGPR